MMLRSWHRRLLAVDEAGGEGGDQAMKYAMIRVPDPRHGPWSGRRNIMGNVRRGEHRGRRYFPDMWSSLRGTDTWNCGGDHRSGLYVNAEKAPVNPGMQRQHWLPSQLRMTGKWRMKDMKYVETFMHGGSSGGRRFSDSGGVGKHGEDLVALPSDDGLSKSRILYSGKDASRKL